ncbi:MAG: excinuclease ABC subunit UvrC [Parachlamydiaceae bacterium]|nr:excinuclease ABC subunit UvrC [Parachlamydiaceae bacterium]
MPFDPLNLDKLPTQPGVYLMKNQNGTVLYVGKANNLRQRVRQYFVSGGDGRLIIPLLVAKVTDIETIVVTSEKEALLLENTLIKQHQPKYNALLKDDKTYIALKVNNRHKWPMVQLVRYKGKPEADGLYFGPYTSAHAARMTLDLIHRVFPLRQCSDQELVRRTRPCILYDMKRCIAPCVDKCSKEEYDLLVNKVIRFLRGQDKEILRELYEEMAQHANELEFEKANAVLRLIRQIEGTLEGQHVNKPLGGDADVIAVYRQAVEVIIVLLVFREGKLMGSRNYNFTNIAEDDRELLSSFLMQEYDPHMEMPDEILLPIDLPDEEVIAEILSANRSKKMRVYQPQRGDKRALLDMAYLNAEATFKQKKDLQAIRERTLLEMQEVLRLNQYPKRIECFDNSNISGTEPVSALVVFTEGSKDKKRYRKYKIKSVSSPDDYATMEEVLTRRFERARDENDLPDLVVIDGGKGHLNVAVKVFARLNIITVDIIAVAKEQGRHDKGMTIEQVFLPNVRDPIPLKRHSAVLFLLQQIRDEAHRFAITFHRQRRNKQTLKSALEEVPGIGPVKLRSLLRHFGSVKKLSEATAEQILEVKGISKANVEALLQYFAKGEGT